MIEHVATPTRDRIVASGAELFRRQGFAGTGVKRLPDNPNNASPRIDYRDDLNLVFATPACEFLKPDSFLPLTCVFQPANSLGAWQSPQPNSGSCLLLLS